MELLNNPKYLTCPYCPAQAFMLGWVDMYFLKYECPSHHTFYVKKEILTLHAWDPTERSFK